MVEYVEFLTASKAETNDSYAEVEIATPNRLQGMQMVIHKVEAMITDITAGVTVKADEDYMVFWLLEKTFGSAYPANGLDDPNVICVWGYRAEVGAAGTVVLSIVHSYDFKIPKLYPKKSIWFGMQIDVGSKTVTVRIHYTMRFVSQRQLYNALTD